MLLGGLLEASGGPSRPAKGWLALARGEEAMRIKRKMILLATRCAQALGLAHRVIRRLVADDKKHFYHDTAWRAACADERGDSKEVYKLV